MIAELDPEEEPTSDGRGRNAPRSSLRISTSCPALESNHILELQSPGVCHGLPGFPGVGGSKDRSSKVGAGRRAG